MENFRDYLLNSLKTLPGSREFHLHTLVSAPKKHQELFPFARPRPRTYLQDILVLLSEQSTPDSPRLFVTAIEAFVYHIPQTSCAILYIAKVDTTGQSALPSPTTALVKALLLFYLDPATRPVPADHLWIHLFARAQGQYLFPNSAEFPGKHPLSDLKLCGWWKRVLTAVATDLVQRTNSTGNTKLYYILPGYGKAEAEALLKIPAITSSSTSTRWIYGHPYTQNDIPLPCPKNKDNLGHFIPYFDDCPKSRFLDEIAYTTEREGIKSPARKRQRTMSHSDSQDLVQASAEDVDEKVDGNADRPLGELGKVTAEEFWERMSFRQECVAGAVTGFFVLGCALPILKDATDTKTSSRAPFSPQPGQVSSQINKRVITSLMTGVEFSTLERARRGTETLENAIRGLCDGITATLARPIDNKASDGLRSFSTSTSDRRTPEREAAPSAFLAPRTPPRRRETGPMADISPNPFPEPELSLDTYHSYIYGSVSVNNPITGRDGVRDKEPKVAESHVTVLAVRKKKKRPE